MRAYKLPEHYTVAILGTLRSSAHNTVSFPGASGHKSLDFEHSKLFSLTTKSLPWERNKSKKDILSPFHTSRYLLYDSKRH